MKLENQVCALEQAKKLKELGIEQKSLCFWKDEGYPKAPILFMVDGGIYGEYIAMYPELYIAAFTVGELGVMVPPILINASPFIHHNGLSWHNMLIKEQDGINYHSDHKNEADARAALLIYLLENNITTAEEVNQRLLAA